MRSLFTALLLALGLLLSPTLRAQDAAADGGAVREVQIGAAQFQRGTPLPAWVQPVATLPSTSNRNSPVVTLLADTVLHVASDGSHVHRAWQVNGAAALTDMGQQSIEFNPAYQRAQLHVLRIHRQGQVLDRLAAAKITFLQREQGLEQGLYSGLVMAAILVDDLRVGDALEIAYTVSGNNPVFGGRYSDSASWDQGLPTELRRVTLLAPADRRIAWRLVGDVAGTPVQPLESTAGGLRQLRWEGRGLPRTEIENAIPSDVLPARYLQFSEWGGWAEVSDWAQQLFAPAADSRAALAPVLAELGRKATPAERAAAALVWVQNEIRYVSLSLGESSHRPAAPALTLQRRYGDCKDKSLLLVELLRGLGITAEPVLVASRVPQRLDRFLPSPTVFDHAIVRAELDGRSFFLDPTRLGQAGRLDAMGQVWEQTDVLVVTRGNAAFTRIVSPNFAAISRNELTEVFSLPKIDGPGTLKVTQVISGPSAEYRRLGRAQTDPAAFQKAMLEAYQDRYPGVRHRSPAVQRDDAENNVVTLELDLEVPKLAVQSGSSWGVRFRPANLMGVLRSDGSGTRTLPLALSVPRKLQYRVEMEFPPEVSKLLDPVQRRVRDAAFQLEYGLSFRGNRASGTVDMSILADRVPADRLGAYQAALRQAGELPSVFIVDRADFKATRLFGLSTPTLAQTIAGRLQGRVAAITRTVDSGRLQGDDLAEALCDRAEAQVDLEQAEQGLKDAQAAVKAAPNLGRAYECRANVWFGLRDLAKAVADYTRAISLDPAASHAYYRRGNARYFLGQYAQAAEDFAKAGLDSKGDDDGRFYAELWRLWTQKRLGVAPNAQQVAFGTQQPDGEWPRPALALFHDRLSVEQMLKSLDGKKGDDREMALVEAYFYAGQWHLLRGETATAADYFRKAREKGVTVYIEHVSAGIELERMQAAK